MNVILQSLWDSFLYVVKDQYFFPSMAIVVMIGIFIGSTVYDGCVRELKKMMLSLGIYAAMIITITSERIIPALFEGVFRIHRPFAGIVTVLLITFFYFIGMLVGTVITRHAHKGEEV